MAPPASSRPRLAVAGALLAMYATSPGQTFVISGFNGALCAPVDAAAPGLGLAVTALSGSYLVGTLLSAASLTHAGKVADRLGPRRMILLAGVGLALAGLAFSRVTGIVELTLAFFLLRFFGQGVLSMASSHALALRFDARLGSVEGLRGATVSLAIATAPLIAVATVRHAGWRDAAWMLALGAGVLALVAGYGLMDADPEVETPRGGAGAATPAAGFTLAQARRRGAFWILVLSTSYTAALVTAVHFHLQPLLAARAMDEEAAAATFAPYAAAGLVTTLVGGVLVDRLRPAPLLAAAMALLGGATVLLGLAEPPWAAHLAMGLLGTGHGLLMAVGGPTLARYFGRAHHGAIRGAAGTAAVAGSAAGPFALSAAAEPLGGFGPGLLALAAAALPLVWAGARLRDPRGA